MFEEWKRIEDTEYLISSFGRVRSLKFKREKILSQGLNSCGYYFVCLSHNRKQFTRKVHQLVAIAFLDHKTCGHKLVVNHKDLNKLNNNVSNLEIITNRENCNKKHIKSTSKFVGVSWQGGRLNKWTAQIVINGKKVYLGSFDTEFDAHKAYQEKAETIK